jgi:hypothetical protein
MFRKQLTVLGDCLCVDSANGDPSQGEHPNWGQCNCGL